jgi:hypothetical protein
VEKWPISGDKRPQPVDRPWTTRGAACGPSRRPQAVEIVRPRIHRRLTWSDDLPPHRAVDKIGTTSRSPGCGREKVGESVEGGRNVAEYSNTRGPQYEAGVRGRTAPRGSGRRPGGLRGASEGRSPGADGPPRARTVTLGGRHGALWAAAEGFTRAFPRRCRGCCPGVSGAVAGGVLRALPGRSRGVLRAFRRRQAPASPSRAAERLRGSPGGTAHAKAPPEAVPEAPRRAGRRRTASDVPSLPSVAGQPFLMRLVSSVTWL